MSNTDSIADMLTRIRNAINATHEVVEMPFSKLKLKIAELLKREGYINSYEVDESDKVKKKIKIFLKYGPRGERVITGLKKVSKPGLRVYTSWDKAPRVFGGLGISVISTSQGLITDKEARKQKVGGEIICKVW